VNEVHAAKKKGYRRSLVAGQSVGAGTPLVPLERLNKSTGY